ncbi:hypothetical protein KKD03_03135 [Patescibacteria group bacterium]|nr:hypothetical protein [Patescibacteria group bacterium]
MFAKEEAKKRPLIIETPKLSLEEMSNIIKDKQIGQIHYFLYGTDGVSLQAQETQVFLNSLGAKTFSLAADTTESEISSNSPELDYHNKNVTCLRDKILDQDMADLDQETLDQQENALLTKINNGADVIYQQMITFIDENRLDIVHIRNLSALPFLHIQAAVAVHEVIKNRPETRFILHHHDFYWEGPDATKYVSKYEKINKLVNKITAPNFENTRHICINTIAQAELKKRKGVVSTFIPDGFDFDKEVEEMSQEDKKELLEKYGIKENDLVLALTTRTRKNKGYQTAIRIVKSIQDKRKLLENHENGVGRSSKTFDSESNIFLLVIQSADFDSEYYSKIKEYAKEMGVKLVFIGDDIVADAQYTNEDQSAGKHSFYSFIKSGIVDGVLYVPTHEGWGNQAIEAAWAKIIMMMFGYPVAVKDILSHINGIIQVGDSDDLEPWEETGLPVVKEGVVEESTNELIKVLLDHDLENKMTEKAYGAFRQLCHIQKIGMQYLELYFWRGRD